MSETSGAPFDAKCQLVSPFKACKTPIMDAPDAPNLTDRAEQRIGASLACVGQLAEEKAAFLAQAGSKGYGYDGWLDQNYDFELGNRIGKGQVYLDYTGAGQYTTSQVSAALAELTGAAFGNPHSRNPSSARATAEVTAARAAVLAHFRADPSEYHVVFTKGATEGLKIVAEYFPWNAKSTFTYTEANHKSVLGIGTYAKRGGAKLRCLSTDAMQKWLDTPPLPATPAQHPRQQTLHLVAYPRKCNYEGVLYPESWTEEVHARSDASNRYLVVLDAAAFIPTHALDLSVTKPDFVPISFYKLFGYPSGLGALLVRREAAAALTKFYFGGGSVDYCTAQDAWHVLSPLPSGWEDGTIDYLGITSLKHGFAALQKLGGMDAIAAHVESLRAWTHSAISGLCHANGTPLVRLFGRHDEGPAAQSGIFQFQVLCPRGNPIPPGVVEAAAMAAGLHLRTGCNCNPGRCLSNLGITPDEERRRAAEGHRGQLLTVLRPASNDTREPRRAAASAGGAVSSELRMVAVQLPVGTVRVSLGAYSRFEDVHAFVAFLYEAFVDKRGMRLVAASSQELDKPVDLHC